MKISRNAFSVNANIFETSETTTVTIGKYIPVEQKDDPSNAGGSVAGTSSPQTGDNSHLVIWFSLFVVSGIVLSGVSLYRRKKK